MILYGIPTCDTCKKALKALQAAGQDVTFRDLRAQPLSTAEIAEIVAGYGTVAGHCAEGGFDGVDLDLESGSGVSQGAPIVANLVTAMKQLKAKVDPKGLMNPGSLGL